MNPIAYVTVWIAAHHGAIVEAGALFFLVANGAIKIALYLHPLADWVTIAERNPRVAALVRLMSAMGLSPVAILQALVDFVRGHASPGTRAFTRAFAVSASKPLISPAQPGPSYLPDVVMLCRRCGTTWSGPYPMPMRCSRCDDPPAANDQAKQPDTIRPPKP